MLYNFINQIYRNLINRGENEQNLQIRVKSRKKRNSFYNSMCKKYNFLLNCKFDT